MHDRVALIANPLAGAVRDGRVRSAGLVTGAEFFEPSSLEALDRVASELGDAKVVAIVGGDGTLHRVVTAFVRARGTAPLPDFAIVPAGTNNAVGRNVGVRDVEPTTAEVLLGSGTRTLPTLAVTIDDGVSRRTEYGFSVGAGLVVRAFREYLEDERPGLVAAVRAIASPLLGTVRDDGFFAPVRLSAVVDGRPAYEGRLTALVASVVDDPLRMLEPLGPPLRGRPGFHLALAALPFDRVVRELPRILAGRNGDPLHRVDEASELELEVDEGLMLEGDVLSLPRGTRVSVRRGPDLRIRIPGLPVERAERPPIAWPVSVETCGHDFPRHLAYFRERFGDALLFVVLFGSLTDASLRSPTSIPDFFVVVDDYANVPEPCLERLGHRLLPPDLYHLSSPELACKYYVISRETLWRTTGPDAPDLYVLGRFSKRTELAYARDVTARALYEATSARAALAACRHGASLLEGEVEAHELAHEVIRLSYRGEMRLEDERKTRALLASAEEHYRRVFGACFERLVEEGVLVRTGADRFRRGPAADREASLALLVRSVRRAKLRYPKMILTVDDWIGLLAAKLERTHGIHVDIPDWERPIFLITGWRHFLRLRRQGKIH